MNAQIRIKWSNRIVNSIISIAFILGMLNMGTMSMVEANSGDGTVTPLTIAQGDSIHQSMHGQDMLEFMLDVDAPQGGGSAYFWEIGTPAAHGEALVTARGASAQVRYFPDANFNNTDYFTVKVSDGAGNTDQVSVFVDVNPRVDWADVQRQTLSGMRENTSQRTTELQQPLSENQYAPSAQQVVEDSIQPGQSSIEVSSSLPRLLNDLQNREDFGAMGEKGNSEAESDNEIFLISPSSTDPYFDVDPDFDRVWGYNWPAEVLVDLYIEDDFYSSETSSSSGEVYFEMGDIGPGNTLSMTDGNTTKTFTILSLMYNGVDEVNDLVYGKTVGLGTVEVYACDTGNNCKNVDAIVNESGEFYADFYISVDIAPGSGGYLRSIDPDGDATRIGWGLPLSTFAVNPEENSAWGMHWPANTLITLTKGVSTAEATSDEGGNIDFGNVGFEIETGDTITVSGATTSKSLTVFLLGFTSADEDNELITGNAEPNSEVYVRACDLSNYCSEHPVTVDDFGNFTANFTGYVDIAPGSFGNIQRTDTDGDSTEIFWRIPNPKFSVNYVMNYVWGTEWIPGSTVTLNVEGSDVASATVEDNGNLFIDTSSLDIQPGYTVTLSDGTTTKELLVQTLTVTTVDLDTDTVSGTADEFSEVVVDTDDGRSVVITSADGSGYWSADFTGLTDIVKGSYGFARRIDDDGDWTEGFWRVPNPSFRVNPENDNVWGWEWPSDTEITLTINGNPYPTTVFTNENGDFNFDQLGIDIQVGDELQVSGGGILKDHTVLAITFTGYDELDDTVSGIAAPGATVNVWGCDYDNCTGMDVKADETTGEFTAYMNEIGIDIAPGTNGNVARWDNDNDGTQIDWRVPNPSFVVNPENDNIWGWEWPANTEVEIMVDGNPYYRTTNGNGDFGDQFPYDIQVGHFIQVSGGGIVKDHTVRDLTFTGFDEVNDTVSGNATPGATVNVWGCDYDNCAGMDVTADETTGDFTANMDEIDIDIAPGTSGNVARWDNDNDGTQVDWRIPNPSFAVNPENDNIWGWEWPANTEVEIMVDGNPYYRTTNGNGDFGDQFPYDIQVGHFIQVSGGGIVKDHTVRDLTFTGFNEVNDTVSGNATPGATVNVWGCDYDNCAGMDVTADETTGDFTANMNEIDIDIAPGTSGNVARWDTENDGTVIDWRVPNPSFRVNPEYDNVWGWEWPADTEITLTINGNPYSTTVFTNENGEFNFDQLGIDIKVDDVLQVSGGGIVKDHTVLALTFTGYEELDDTVSGIAAPGATVNVWACDYDNCAGMDVKADETTGEFTAYMNEIGIDIAPGTNGNVARWDNDNDGTQIDWRVLYPRFTVNLNQKYVYGEDWTPGNTVTLNIDETDVAEVVTDEDQHIFFDTSSMDIQPGQTVTVTEGASGTVKSLLVKPLSVTGVDPDTDTVTGTAENGGVIEVETNGVWISLEVGASGTWTADFSGRIDLVPGMEGHVRQWDEDGDWTECYWHIPNPFFNVYPEEDTVAGWDWPPYAEVELQVGGFTDTETTNENGEFKFNSIPYDIGVGDAVQVSVGTTIVKTHTVRALAFSGYNLADDTVSGTADSLFFVWVRACDPDSCEGIKVTPEPSGTWQVDFTGIKDLKPGNELSIQSWDEDNDGTEVILRVPNPSFDVNPENDNVWGWEWPADATIALTINEIPYPSTVTTNENGDFSFGNLTVDIEVGDVILVNDETTFKSHTVLALAFTGADAGEDTVSGTAPSGRFVSVWTCDETDKCIGLDTNADESGNWTVDFTGTVDLVRGSHGGFHVSDEDNDGTCLDWRIPNPSFAVNPVDDSVWGWEWPALTELTLTAKGNTYQAYTNEYGDVDFGRPGPDLVAGDILTLSDDVTIKTHTVYNLAYTGYDLAADTISGHADEGSPVHVWACDDSHCVGVDPVVPSSGEWVADFFGQMDLVQGTGGGMQIMDDDNDDTRIDWRIPDPQIRVYPDAGMQFIQGSEWLPNTDIDLMIDGESYVSIMSDENGEVSFTDLLFEIVPGMVVEMTDGQSTRTHTVIDITFTDIDEEYDTVSGTADPGEVQAYACDLENGCQFVYPTANEFRNWTADFNDLVDIASGSDGGARQYDEEGNSTRVYWSIAFPYLIIFPEKDLVEGYQWMPGATVTLDIGTFHDSKAAAEDGSVAFLLSTFDIQPGQEVVMSDGVSTKNHVVREIAVTEFDDVADHVIGTADAGSTVFVAAFNDAPWGSTTTHVTADGAGIWVADFSDYEDIKLGTYGFVEQEDEDRDYTHIDYLFGSEVPVINSLSPSYTIMGLPALTVEVNGQFFADGYSTVLWNGEVRETDFVSDTQLSVHLDSADLAAAGSATIEVFTAEPGGGTSNSVEFPIIAISPAIGQKLATSTVTFDWDDIPGANKYRIQLSLDPSFNTTVFTAKTTASTYAYLTNLTNAKTYYWRIQPRYGDTWGDWLPALMFYSKNPPTAPELVSPLSGTITNDNDVTLTWNTAERGEYYRVQIAKDLLFTTTVLDETLGTGILSKSLPDFADGKYYWRVRAYDEVDAKGKWSAVWSFKVDTKPPAVTALYKPKNGAVKTSTPNFSWYAASGAKTYVFEYGTTPGFTTPTYSSPSLAVLSHKPPAMAEGTYYWRVRAFDKAGNESVSAERMITIDLP